MKLDDIGKTCKYFGYSAPGERMDICVSGAGRRFRKIYQLRIELENKFFVLTPLGPNYSVTTSFHLSYSFAFSLGHFIHENFRYYEVFDLSGDKRTNWFMAPHKDPREIEKLAVNKLGNVTRFWFLSGGKTIQFVDVPKFLVSEICQFIAEGAMRSRV